MLRRDRVPLNLFPQSGVLLATLYIESIFGLFLFPHLQSSVHLQPIGNIYTADRHFRPTFCIGSELSHFQSKFSDRMLYASSLPRFKKSITQVDLSQFLKCAVTKSHIILSIIFCYVFLFLVCLFLALCIWNVCLVSDICIRLRAVIGARREPYCPARCVDICNGCFVLLGEIK